MAKGNEPETPILPKANKKALVKLYFFTLLTTGVILFFYRSWSLFSLAWPLMAAPLWVFTGHVLTGFSYWITSLSVKKGITLFQNSFLAYWKFRSFTGLQNALLISLSEEMVFRYLLLNWLNSLLINGLLAALVVSLLFTLFHFFHGLSLKSLFRYTDFFIFSLILCFLTLATESIYPAILIHATRNYLLKVMFVSKDVYQNMINREAAKQPPKELP